MTLELDVTADLLRQAVELNRAVLKERFPDLDISVAAL